MKWLSGWPPSSFNTNIPAWLAPIYRTNSDTTWSQSSSMLELSRRKISPNLAMPSLRQERRRSSSEIFCRPSPISKIALPKSPRPSKGTTVLSKTPMEILLAMRRMRLRFLAKVLSAIVMLLSSLELVYAAFGISPSERVRAWISTCRISFRI